MSDIPRYSANPLWFPWSFVDNPMGKFCEYRDYVKLKAENERLRHEQKIKAIPVEAQLLDRLQELQAENERLRSASFVTAVPSEQYERVIKAGNDLYSLIIVLDYCLGNPEVNNPAKQAWLSVKEGRDAK